MIQPPPPNMRIPICFLCYVRACEKVREKEIHDNVVYHSDQILVYERISPSNELTDVLNDWVAEIRSRDT